MTCKETVKTIFGAKESNIEPSTYKELQKLSSKQKKLRDEIDPPTTKEKSRRKQLKDERNKTLKKIKNLLKTEQTVDLELKEIEEYKEDSKNTTKPFVELKRKNPKSH